MCGFCLCMPRAKLCGPITSCRSRFPKLSKKMLKIYAACFLSMFSTSFASTMMFPFLPFMVEFLLPWLLENEALVATYAGIVASSMYLGRFFGSYIWGTIADRKGRKPVIIVSVILVGLTSAIFGFSVSYEMAVITRFLVGLTNGVLGTVKAVISEVSDNSNQAFGIAIYASAWGVGIIVGPAVSGAISNPIGQYNLTIESDVVRDFLTRFPYSLPCLVNLALCLLAAVVSFFFLPETLGLKKNQRRSEVPQKDITLITSNNADSASSTSTSTNNSVNPEQDSLSGIENGEDEETNSESALLIHDRSNEGRSNPDHTSPDLTYTQILSKDITVSVLKQDGDSMDISSDGDVMEQSDDIIASDSKSDEEVTEDDQTELLTSQNELCLDVNRGEHSIAIPKRRESWGHGQSKKIKMSFKESFFVLLSFFVDIKPALSLLSYCIFSFAEIGFHEIYSVWAKTSPHLGGLGFSLSEIGITLTVSGVLLLPLSLFAFPLVEKRLGLIRTYQVFFIIVMPSMMLLPNIHYLTSDDLRWFLWVLVCLLLLVVQLCITVGFSCQSLFINNSVTFDKLGSVNGLVMSLTALIRTFAPFVSGLIFTASLSEAAVAIGYPFDYRLIFLIFGLIFLLCVLLASCLPMSINKQRIIEDLDISTS